MITIKTSVRADGNMSYRFGSEKEVTQNRKRFLEYLHTKTDQVSGMEQVHGNHIELITKPGIYKQTDGLITKEKDIFLSVESADCIPLFFQTDDEQAIGIAHVGWQGALKELPQKMVFEFWQQFDIKPEQLTITFGPYICPNDYTINTSDKRAQIFPTIPLPSGKVGLDIGSFVTKQLIDIGIDAKKIINEHICTAHNKNLYWSWHRDGDLDEGRMLSVIGRN